MGEWALRRFAPQDLRPPMFNIDPYVGSSLIPNLTVRHRNADFDVTYTINAAGYRGRLYTPEKPANTFRIVALGDSFCFGHGVNDGQTFSSLLERRLSPLLGQNVEAVNLGVMGYGTEQELIRLEREGLAYHPDVVVLAFFSNDPDDDRHANLFRWQDGHLVQQQSSLSLTGYKKVIDKIPGYTWLVGHSEIAALLRDRFWEHTQAHADTVVKAAAVERDYTMTGRLLDRFRQLSQQDHFDFVILIVGGSGVSLKPGTPDYYVRQYAIDHHVAFVDTSAWLAGYFAQAHLTDHAAFYPHDGHWKPWVHERAAELLTDQIARMRSVSSGAPIVRAATAPASRRGNTMSHTAMPHAATLGAGQP